MSRHGSLGYQMMSVLQRVFRPGHSRHQDKRFGRRDRIRSIRTMRDMCADVHSFGRFIREHYPQVRQLPDITPDMAAAFIQELVSRELSDSYLTRNRCSLRKLDRACRLMRIIPRDRGELLPLDPRSERRAGHPRPTPQAYSPADAEVLIRTVREKNATIADLLELMHASGLRVSEAVYLRAEDILVEPCCLILESNANHTKGGRPRRVTLPAEARPWLARLRAQGLSQADGHVFADRRQLRMRAKDLVRRACPKLGIACLGTHGLRRSFAAAEYLRAIRAGATDREALLNVSLQLGHNRIQVAAYSYVPAEIRVDKLRRGRPRKNPISTERNGPARLHTESPTPESDSRFLEN